MASKAPIGRAPNPKVLEHAKTLIEYADGRRPEPPKAEGVSAAELYLALRVLGRDPVEVAKKARERWERQRGESPKAAPPAAPAAAGAGRPKAPAGAGRVILKAKSIGGRLSDKGRVKAVFADGTEYSLDASRIRGIHYLDGVYYVEYETENPEFYAKHAAPEIPQLAVPLGFSVKEEVEERCKGCGKPILWDADEPYCPRCGWDDFPGYEEVRVKKLEVKASLRDELEEFAERLLGTRCELVELLYRTPAGGYWPKGVDLRDVKVKLPSAEVEAAAVAENPVFEESHWDEAETYERKFEGKYLILMLKTGLERWDFALLRIHGEPKLDLLERLAKEEEERGMKEKEEARRREEERRRREEEEKRKWSDPSAVAKEIASKLPDWADAAYVEQKAVWGEDADVVTYVLPAKKSRRGEGYYTSESWRAVGVDVPERFLEPLAGKVILRDGTVVSAKRREGWGKYVELEVEPSGRRP